MNFVGSRPSQAESALIPLLDLEKLSCNTARLLPPIPNRLQGALSLMKRSNILLVFSNTLNRTIDVKGGLNAPELTRCFVTLIVWTFFSNSSIWV